MTGNLPPTGWNLPPGCTDADIDRAAGGYDECYHESFEIDRYGRARCNDCGDSWWASIEDRQYLACDAYCRKEERRERWRQFWRKLMRKLRRDPRGDVNDEVPF